MTQKNKLKTTYSPQRMVLALIIMFMAAIGLFEAGFFGVLLDNLIRLVFGQAFDVFLMFIFLYGGSLLLRPQHEEINGKLLLGVILIFMALTFFLHFKAYQGQSYSMGYLNQVVWKTFKEDFTLNQLSQSMAGGFLGALVYSLSIYAFGSTASFALFTFLFLLGLILVANCRLAMVLSAFKSLGYSMVHACRSLYDGTLELKEVFNAPDIKEESSEKAAKLDVESVSPTEVDQSSTPSFLQKMKNQLKSMSEVFGSDEADSPLDSTTYQPSFKEKPSTDFVSFSSRDHLASTAKEKRDDSTVIDLDYFDQLNKSSTEPASNKEAIVSYDSKVTSNRQPDRPASPAVEERVCQPQVAEQAKRAEVAESFPDIQPPQKRSTMTEAAEHWQSQKTQTQALTDDDWPEIVENQQAISLPAHSSKDYQLPSVDLLNEIQLVDQSEEYERINENIDKLELTFDSFGIKAKVVKANLGPSVTKYEIEPGIGVKVSRIVSLADDIALALAARDVRIEAPIPGKSLIGIEVPNQQVSPVSFREIVESALASPHPLEVPLGRDISGSVALADLSKMPHLLIAGATGSGKSVGMNVIIASLLMKAKPDEVKFLMIDPKKVELSVYNEIPHLLSPVVTNPRKAAQALNKVVQEMEERYEKFAATGVRNIDGFNDQVDDYNRKQGLAYEKMPKIVVLIDELADLMLVASNEVETAIIRLAQMARAAGIHMIIATQRPSVDVITGIIKANIPSRLAFAVSSGTDSRTILDSNGAEKLLGRGDMLFQPMGKNKPVRVQGAYISDGEVERIVDFVKSQQAADYDEKMTVSDEDMDLANQSDDEYFEEAIELIKGQETISISQLQRRFRIGYNRAARMVDDLEAAGYITEADGSRPRQVLIQEEE